MTRPAPRPDRRIRLELTEDDARLLVAALDEYLDQLHRSYYKPRNWTASYIASTPGLQEDLNWIIRGNDLFASLRLDLEEPEDAP